MTAPSTASLSAMYQDRLLAEYRAPKHRRVLVEATAKVERKNPVCGDAICVMIDVRDGLIVDVAFTGQGCSIAVASASLLAQSIRRLRRRDALDVIDAVESSMRGHRPPLPELLSPLLGVAPFSGRHGCALLPWQALREALG